jgi:hypothetical protein
MQLYTGSLPLGTPQTAQPCRLRPSIHPSIHLHLPIENLGVQKYGLVSPLRSATPATEAFASCFGRIRSLLGLNVIEILVYGEHHPPGIKRQLIAVPTI